MLTLQERINVKAAEARLVELERIQRSLAGPIDTLATSAVQITLGEQDPEHVAAGRPMVGPKMVGTPPLNGSEHVQESLPPNGTINMNSLRGLPRIRRRSGTIDDSSRPIKPLRIDRQGQAKVKKDYGIDLYDKPFYENVDGRKTIDRATRQKFLSLISLAKAFESDREDHKTLQRLRDLLHELEYHPRISHSLLVATKMLESGQGLLYIIENVNSAFGADLIHDALALYRRWKNGDIEPNMFRGTAAIDDPSGELAPSKWPFPRFGGECGNLSLQIGQWWPAYACLVRDGVHMATQAGIAGNRSTGAASVVISGGVDAEKYDDVDEGDRVLYSGSFGGPTETQGTKYLKLSVKNGQPIRLFRYWTADSKYAPEVGMRYDGMYRVNSQECIDADKHHWRFELLRCPGQSRIRAICEDKATARPTELEKKQFYMQRDLRRAARGNGVD